MKEHTMVNMHGVLETIAVDGGKPRYVSPDRRYWPNPVTGEYCATIEGPDGQEDEHWYDERGAPVDPDSPLIRNRAPALQKDRLQAAFVAGCAAMSKDSGFTEEALFEDWYAANKATLLDIAA